MENILNKLSNRSLVDLNYKLLGFFDIDYSYFESISTIEGILLVIFIYAISAFIGTVYILINFLIRMLELEKKEFVLKRKWLHKYILISLKVNNFWVLYILITTILCIIGILYFTIWTLGYINIK